MKPLTAGFQTGLPLAKDEPISDGGSTFHFKKWGKLLQNSKERTENLWEEQPFRHQGQWRKGRRCLQLVVQPMVRLAAFLQLMRYHKISTWASEGIPHGPGGCSEEVVALLDTFAGAGSWQDTWFHGERNLLAQVCWQDLWSCRGPTLALSVPGRLHSMEETHAAVLQKLPQCVWKHSCWKFTLEDCVLWKGAHTEAEEDCEESSHWRRSNRDNMWWTDHNTHSTSPCATGGNEGEKIRSKGKPGKKGGANGRCFKIWFYFILSYSELLGEN